MKCRKMDSNGDMLPIIAESDMATGSNAVALAVRSRLNLLYGEWWENEDDGFEVPSFLFDGNKMYMGEEALSSYIRDYIQKTDGITSATVSATQDGRKVTVNCTINTEYGSESGDIGNELLRAIY